MGFGFLKNRKSPVKEVSKSKKNEIDSALANSENTVNLLTRKQELLESRIKECVERALESNKKGDRAGALGHLRRKKLLTEELNKLRSSLLALESQNIALEGAQMQHMAISALTDSLNAQKSLQSSVNVARFDDLMDELEETKENQMEVFDTMTQNVSTYEFEDELDELVKLDKNKSDDKERNLDDVLEGLSAPSNRVKLQTNQSS